MMSQRQCILLKGETEWCHSSAITLLADYDLQNIIYLSQHIKPTGRYKTITQKQAQQQLGKEFDAVVFDATEGFNADSFGAIVGTVKAGGALVILLPRDKPESLWLQRFSDIANTFCLEQDCFYSINQDDELPILSVPEAKPRSYKISATNDQSTAIDAILKVVHGHRRRPLVLTSDRGRGKSAALGMAAAELIKQGKQSIIVTAPSLATVVSLFEHASRLLPDAKVSRSEIELDGAVIRFIAPDALLESELKADLVLVDEAAAIPAGMLGQLLSKFSRLVFASTLHGYEGTGLGFAIRFQQTLDNITPNWRGVAMTQPIRWADNDALETFSFKALLLNAEPVNADVVAQCQLADLQFERVDQQALLNDETRLTELFGLMVLAHYRTRPSDLQMMLDRDDISVYVLSYQGHIVASAWLVKEGGLDSELADAIYAGERRLKGHLLPQSLLAHAGLREAGYLTYQRIIRLAVHPALQRNGIGQSFVQQIVTELNNDNADVLGASFAASPDIISFWSQCQFKPIRLGLHHDEVSGSHAMMMLKPLSKAGESLLVKGMVDFSTHWPLLLQQEFQRLSPELVITISQLMPVAETEINDDLLYEIKAFAFRQRSFDASRLALWRTVSQCICQPEFLALSEQQQCLCILLILQQRSIVEVAKHLGFTGKTQTINALRHTLAELITNKAHA